MNVDQELDREREFFDAFEADHGDYDVLTEDVDEILVHGLSGIS